MEKYFFQTNESIFELHSICKLFETHAKNSLKMFCPDFFFWNRLAPQHNWDKCLDLSLYFAGKNMLIKNRNLTTNLNIGPLSKFEFFPSFSAEKKKFSSTHWPKPKNLTDVCHFFPGLKWKTPQERQKELSKWILLSWEYLLILVFEYKSE